MVMLMMHAARYTPGCPRVSSRSAAFTAVRRVENLGLVERMSATVSPEVLVSTGLAATELLLC